MAGTKPGTKRLSNAYSTGGAGPLFEARVQASFLALMLTGGYAPVIRSWPISKIKLQGKVDGYDTDDLIVFVENKESREQAKLHCQVKHSVAITKDSPVFAEVIQAAWSDFHDDTFKRGRDAIALVTGPLNQTDYHNAKWLLEQARVTESCDDFLRRIKLANFKPPRSVEKYEAFKHQIAKAKGSKVSDEEVYDFLNAFHLLGYDLDGQLGVVEALLHSHIGQLSDEQPVLVWTHLVEFVQTWNMSAGTIVLEKVPEATRDLFRKKVSYMPKELTVEVNTPLQVDFSSYPHPKVLAQLALIGGWREQNELDCQAVERIAGETYATFIEKVRDVLQAEGGPLSLRDGHWSVKDRRATFAASSQHIYDANLSSFQDVVIDVLSEPDQLLDTDSDSSSLLEAMTARPPSYSAMLRNGLAETLTLLGVFHDELVNCSRGNAELVVSTVVRKALREAGWVRWGSLNAVLPLLAEAAPEVFLECLEESLKATPSPFLVLFGQEGDGSVGRNYLTGLFYALETLAWQERHFVRACMNLGALAAIDPGGKWANRPSNSLVTIFLPWLPQTNASVQKRKTAVLSLFKEYPTVASRLAFNLLPNQVVSSSGTRKPLWREPVANEHERVINQAEYAEQVANYAEMLIDWASTVPQRLNALVSQLNNLPRASVERLLVVLGSPGGAVSEEDRLLVWDGLTSLVRHHRRFSDATWALPTDTLDNVENIAARWAPTKPDQKHRVLFSGKDFDLYEDTHDYAEQEKRLQEKRLAAVEAILQQGGLEGVVSFAEAVEDPYFVGYSLGDLGEGDADKLILPSFLDNSQKKKYLLARGYLFRRHQLLGWTWADSVVTAEWSDDEKAQFLSAMTFENETFVWVEKWLGPKRGLYWGIVRVNAYGVEKDFGQVVEHLLASDRASTAVDFIYVCQLRKTEVEPELVYRTLMAATEADQPNNVTSAHNSVELIGKLQSLAGFDEDKLANLEWAYLPLLDGHMRASPRVLEKRLAKDPTFFCKTLRIVYRPEGAIGDSKEGEEGVNPSLANHVWRLLRHWTVVPGTSADGAIDSDAFNSWLDAVLEACKASGHLNSALFTIGYMLIRAPGDTSGLWIAKACADALNKADADAMREGYWTGVVNSRGAHYVDPMAKPELELAAQFNQRAEDVENEGFFRFAVTLRLVADFYQKQAQRIIDEHGSGED